MTEISNVLDDSTPKARKPYTISKQREKWSEEEHNKFLEALKLYSRNWRRIEEHIGTKTTIQIRSHAQKFFSKVARESNNKEPINIPPPRPKRKPAHPYPRKLGNAKPGKQILVLKNSEMGEQESSSPLSVLSTEFMSPVVGSSETDTNEPNKLSNNMESEENCENEEICEESVSLKLFGKMVNPAQNADTNIQFAPENTEMDIESSTTSTTEQSEDGTNAYQNNNNYNISNPFLCYNYCAPQLLFWNPYGNMSYLIKPEPVSPKVNNLEENIIESNNNYSQKMSNNVIDLGRTNEEKSLRGFVPYKRCVAEIEKVETRLCL